LKRATTTVPPDQKDCRTSHPSGDFFAMIRFDQTCLISTLWCFMA
jgi:hypothetical protein